MRRWVTGAVASVLVLLVSCTSGPVATPTPEPPSVFSPPSPTDAVSPSPAQLLATLAGGASLPATCTPGSPRDSDTVVFVSGGHAWALDRKGTRATCLFDVTDPGPFAWGPLGDRAIVGGLQVAGLAGAPSLPATADASGPVAWSTPTGKSIVYAPTDGTSLQKLHLDGAPQDDVTPLNPARYLSVVYHPSGLAFAFAVERPNGKQSIWLSSNTGKKPDRLVFSDEGTTFGALGFDADGTELIYAAVHADGHPALHSLDLSNPSEAPVLWDGPAGQHVLDLRVGLDEDRLAWTAGTSCDDGVAWVRTGGQPRHALSSDAGSTRAVGWLDERRILVATGPCTGPFDLTSVDVVRNVATPVAFGVDAVAVRTAAPTPPPPLPTAEAGVGSGFA